jgi:hypothetical protein
MKIYRTLYNTIILLKQNVLFSCRIDLLWCTIKEMICTILGLWYTFWYIVMIVVLNEQFLFSINSWCILNGTILYGTSISCLWLINIKFHVSRNGIFGFEFSWYFWFNEWQQWEIDSIQWPKGWSIQWFYYLLGERFILIRSYHNDKAVRKGCSSSIGNSSKV